MDAIKTYSLILNSRYLFYHLTLEIRGYIRDMYPAAIALPNKLGEFDASFLLHLLYQLEQTTMVSLVARDEVCSTSQQVVTVLCSTHERVQLLTSIATADHDRCSPRLAYGVEELVY